MPKRFVIVSHGRTGSTALCCALNEHPDICCGFELFAETPQATPNPLITVYDGGPCDDFLRRFYACGLAPVIGYKMFTFHARMTEEGFRAWPYLIDESDISIILLGRRNLVDSFFSEKYAAKTGAWSPPNEYNQVVVEPGTTVWVSADEAENYLYRIYAEMTWAREAFARHDVLKLWYEDMAADFDGQLERVWKHLGVDSFHVEMRFESLLGSDAKNIVENYDEVMRRLELSIFSRNLQVR